MPLEIQNYGEWEGDRRGGSHPPAGICEYHPDVFGGQRTDILSSFKEH